MDERRTGFKRLHFFKMFLTEEDWNARHTYHRNKHQFHNLAFHSSGVVPYQGETLEVRARTRPGLIVEVRPGQGIDASGCDLTLTKHQLVEISRDRFPGATTVYIVAYVDLKPIKHVRFKDGRRVNRYFGEDVKIEAVDRPPEGAEIELARIQLSQAATAIRDAEDPSDPLPNEIDLRYRRFCRVFQPAEGTDRQLLITALRQRKYELVKLAGNNLLRSTLSAAYFADVLRLIVESNMLPPLGMGMLLESLNFSDQQVAQLIEGDIDDPWVQQRPEFQEYVKNVQVAATMLDSPAMQRISDLNQMITFNSKTVDHLTKISELYGNESLIYKEGQVAKLEREYTLGEDWEHVKVWSAEMPPTMVVDGLEWHLIGTLDMTDAESELKYGFRIAKAKDAWRTRQKLYFPDGTLVSDSGVAHEGGFSEFTIKGVVPDTHLAIIRMMDYARGDFQINVFCNDQQAGTSVGQGSDTKARWRNWPFVIPAAFVNDDTVHIRQEPVNTDRDVNMYKYWFYQPLGW